MVPPTLRSRLLTVFREINHIFFPVIPIVYLYSFYYFCKFKDIILFERYMINTNKSNK